MKHFTKLSSSSQNQFVFYVSLKYKYNFSILNIFANIDGLPVFLNNESMTAYLTDIPENF